MRKIFQKKDVEVFIIRNQRLSYKKSEDVVLDFIKRRMLHFGFDDVDFVESRESVANQKAAIRIYLSALNPFIDCNLIEKSAQKALDKNLSSIVLQGAVPGTQFVEICFANGEGQGVYHADTQSRYNNQLNLYKYKRLKIFLELVGRNPELHTYNIKELQGFFLANHALISGYASDADSVEYDECPHCGTKERIPLIGLASQPLIGFVNYNQPLYYQCEGCGLGYMTPHVEITQTDRIYDEYDFQDAFLTTSDVASSQLTQKLQTAFEIAENHVGRQAKILDLGGGSGMVSYLFKKRNLDWDVTHSDFENRKQEVLVSSGIHVKKLNFVTDEIGHNAYDLITAFEVIEHVDYKSFLAMLDKVYKALRQGGYFLFSTPDFDSPIVKAFDFYNAYAPHHLLIFSRSWLENYFQIHTSKFSIVDIAVGADLLEDYNSYFSYYEETSPNMQLRAGACVLRKLLTLSENRYHLIDSGFGSEVIMMVRKS